MGVKILFGTSTSCAILLQVSKGVHLLWHMVIEFDFNCFVDEIYYFTKGKETWILAIILTRLYQGTPEQIRILLVTADTSLTAGTSVFHISHLNLVASISSILVSLTNLV